MLTRRGLLLGSLAAASAPAIARAGVLMPVRPRVWAPAAALGAAGTIYTSDETGCLTLVFSDGKQWIRFQDGAYLLDAISVPPSVKLEWEEHKSGVAFA